MYNPFAYAVACKQYKRNDKETFYSNSFASPRSLAELQKPRPAILISQGSHSCRYFNALTQQKSSYYQPENTACTPTCKSSKDNPFIKAMPIRYLEKDDFRNDKIGLTNWERRKYLNNYIKEREENEQNVNYQNLIEEDPPKNSSKSIIRPKRFLSARQEADLQASITRPINVTEMDRKFEYEEQPQFKFEDSFEKAKDQNKKQPLMSKLAGISQYKSSISNSMNRDQPYCQINHKLYSRLSNHISQEDNEESFSNSLQRKEKLQFTLNYYSQKQRMINLAKQHPKIINYRGQIFELIKMN